MGSRIEIGTERFVQYPYAWSEVDDLAVSTTDGVLRGLCPNPRIGILTRATLRTMSFGVSVMSEDQFNIQCPELCQVRLEFSNPFQSIVEPTQQQFCLG